MNAILRGFVGVVALGSLVILGAACGGSDPAEETVGNGNTESAAAPDSSVSDGGGSGGTSSTETGAASASEAFKAMAASEGIYFGEVPEGFPLAIIPVHPDGEIDKSSIDEDGFTLLQMVNNDPDSVFAYYRDHFDGIGWSAGDPFSMGDRTMVGFGGPDAGVDMTLIDQGDGKTFVALALSQ